MNAHAHKHLIPSGLTTLADLAALLEAGGDHRVLRRLNEDVLQARVATGGPDGFTDAELAVLPIAIVLDLETTGLDPREHRIIELAVRRVRYDVATGRIAALESTRMWREDPGHPLPEAIVKLTGLKDADLAGQRIDDAEATALIGSGEIIVAHNASFDRRFLEARLPDLAGLSWACSSKEIDWAARGAPDARLHSVLGLCRLYHEGHRAGADVDAVIAALGHELEPHEEGREGDGIRVTALGELLARSARTTWLVSAIGSPFSTKDALRGRGYRWDAERRTWWAEVASHDLADEEAWLEAHVYAPHLRAGAMGPHVVPVTALTRHR